MCNHWREEVIVGPYKVLVSSFHALLGKSRKSGSELVPTFGFYLDSDWERVKTSYPKEVVPWDDLKAPSLSSVTGLIGTIKTKLAAGEVVDIACYLGHGRAGTLLACLIVDLEKLKPDAAISEVRRRHCSYAVEVPEQVDLVSAYYRSILT